MSVVKWTARRVRVGRDVMWVGTIEVPSHHVAVQARAHEKPQALRRAAALAKGIAENPAIAAFLPPGSSQALKTIGELATSKAAGKAVDVASSGLKKLARWL